jgi:hypothetical protein
MQGQLVASTAYLMSLLLKYLNEQTASRLLQTDILEAEITQNSVTALNGLLNDPPTAILNGSLDEILDVSLNAALSREVCFHCRPSNARMRFLRAVLLLLASSSRTSRLTKTRNLKTASSIR